MSQMHEMSDLTFDLHDRLAKALRVAGMKPGDMARALGVHRNTIGNYLNGRTPVERRTLIAWSFATGVPLEWLEFGHSDSDDNGPDGGGEVSCTARYNQNLGALRAA